MDDMRWEKAWEEYRKVQDAFWSLDEMLDAMTASLWEGEACDACRAALREHRQAAEDALCRLRSHMELSAGVACN